VSNIVRVGIVKAGCIGTLPLIEFLLDERAERKDIEVRVVGSGANMSAEKCVVVAKDIVEFNPDFAVFISPNATLPGPTKGRTSLSEAGIPTVVVSDGPTKKIAQELEGAGFGFIIIDADAMIGARREFLDPTEMALFNSDVIRVLAVTGVFKIVFNALDKLISEVKGGKKLDLPRILVNKEIATEAADFQNPYAKSKAMAAYEISKRVADLSTQGCFKVKEWKSYIPLVSAAHEMMRQAAKLADEARELEKSGDAVTRTPHHSDGMVLKKKKLIEKPTH
jgi:methylenetetrahydromethanopterin dehydrogenase